MKTFKTIALAIILMMTGIGCMVNTAKKEQYITLDKEGYNLNGERVSYEMLSQKMKTLGEGPDSSFVKVQLLEGYSRDQAYLLKVLLKEANIDKIEQVME